MPWSYPLLVTACSSALLAGFGLTLPSAVGPALREHLNLTAGQVRWLKIAFTFGMILAMLLSGLLMDQWGTGEVIILGALLLGGALATLGTAQNARSVLLLSAVAGAGTSLLHAGSILLASRVLVPNTPNATIAAVNLGYFILGLGVVFTAPLCRWLLKNWSLRRSLLILGLICIFPGGVAIIADKPAGLPGTVIGGFQDLSADIRYWLLLAAIVFSYPLEWTLVKWAPQYLESIHFSPKTGARLLAVFWVVLVTARLLAALFVPSHRIGWWVLGLSCLTTIALGNLVGAYRRLSGAFALLVIAFSFGPTTPTAIGMMLNTFPQHPGLAFTTTAAAGLTAVALFAPLLGWITERFSVRYTLALLMLQVLLFLAPFLTLLLWR